MGAQLFCPCLVDGLLRLINLHYISTWLGLFYAKRLENRVYCLLILIFLCSRFLRGFCFALDPIKYEWFPNRFIWQINRTPAGNLTRRSSTLFGSDWSSGYVWVRHPSQISRNIASPLDGVGCHTLDTTLLKILPLWRVAIDRVL